MFNPNYAQGKRPLQVGQPVRVKLRPETKVAYSAYDIVDGDTGVVTELFTDYVRIRFPSDSTKSVYYETYGVSNGIGMWYNDLVGLIPEDTFGKDGLE